MSVRVADWLARGLAGAGCRIAFGIPGGEVVTVIDALDQAGIEVVVPRQETAGGFMAEGVWHTTGAPGILVATLGPGAANTVNAAANALQDRVPLIILTGSVDPAERISFTHQVIDHRAMLAPVVKASFDVVPGAAAATIAKALQLATQHPPGPVHLDLPVSVAALPEPKVAWADRPRVTAMVPANGALAAARAVLSRATRPLAIAGLEVLTHDAVPAVQGFLAATGVPLITTYKAKGVVAEDQAGVIGAGGLSPKADRVLLPLIAEADVIVLIGYDPIEMRAGWRHPFRADQTVIELAGSIADHGMHRADHVFVGDLSAMLTALAVAPATTRWPAGQPGAARAALRQAFQPTAAWGPGAAFATLGEALSDDAIVTIDSGAHRILLSQMWQARLPRRVLQSSGFCTMASAVPLAIGAAVGDRLAGRTRPVVAVVGDGGLEMGLGELATVRDCGLPVVVFVMVDGALALIEMKQRALGLARRAVDLGRTDFAAIADAYGGAGTTVATTSDLAIALSAALRRTDRFSLIACTLPDRAYDGTF